MVHWKGFMHVPAVEQQKMITGQAVEMVHIGKITLIFKLVPLSLNTLIVEVIMVTEDIMAAGSEDQSA